MRVPCSVKKTEETSSSGNDLHSALEKILAQTTKLEGITVAGVATATAAAGAAPVTAGTPQSDEQLQALKAELAAKEAELSQLKTASAATGSAPPAGVAGDLTAKIKELESKLAEYEILEDDIADLSLYKEENARLKTELDKVKASPTSTVAEAVAPPVESGEAIVAEFAQAVSQEPAAPQVNSTLEIPNTGDPMADFESTVQLEKQITAEPVAAAPAPEPAPISVPTPEPINAGDAATPQAEADDLFAEFSQAAIPEADESATLDTDKMMAEMAALVSIEPTSQSSLDESIDTEKMAAEATSLEKS